LIYPIRKSNKPPYIYWKKLVILGLALLLITIPLAIMATEVKFTTEFTEKGHIVVGGRIPSKLPPPEVLAGMSEYTTNITVKVTNCFVRFINFTVYGTNTSISKKPKFGKVSLSVPGVEFFSVKLPSGCNASYTYVIVNVTHPYSFLAFTSAFLSLLGAVTGVLGTMLFIKQRQLMKEEEKYV